MLSLPLPTYHRGRSDRGNVTQVSWALAARLQAGALPGLRHVLPPRGDHAAVVLGQPVAEMRGTVPQWVVPGSQALFKGAWTSAFAGKWDALVWGW